MSAWLKRFGLHLAAAIGATSIFVAAAAVGANQTRQQGAALAPVVALTASPTSRPRRRPTVAVVATPTSASDATTRSQASTGPGPTQVAPLPTPAQTSPTPAQPGPAPVPPGSTAAQPAPDDAPPEPAAVVPEQAGPPAAAVPPIAGAPPAVATTPPAPAAPTQPGSKPAQSRRTPTPAPAPNAPPSAPTPTPEKVAPERSLAGTITEVLPDGLDVLGVGGRAWHVTPAPGALIRLNGKAARLDGLHVGDTVVILGQAQAREGAVFGFLSHAITARRK